MADDVQPITGTTAKAAARLCNFNTDDATLMPAHLLYLDTVVAPVIVGMQGPWVDLFGYASRVGNKNLNLALSQRRLDNVKAHIARFIPNINFQMQRGFGEDESGPNEHDNNGYWRAVEVHVYAHRPPPPTEVPPVEPAGANTFEIRVVAGASAAKILQIDGYVFQIVDLTRQQTAFFAYAGAGVSLAIPSLPGLLVSGLAAGPAVAFRTDRSVNLSQFACRAALLQDPGVSLGLGLGGTLRLALKDMRDSAGPIGTKPRIIPIESGPGISSPSLGSASDGVLKLVGSVMPFTGY